MKKFDIFPAWYRILRGYRPFLSIEITKECPLRCPGCYAYQPDHVAKGVELRQLGDLRGSQLVGRVLELVGQLRPLHVSIVGGEPLVRWRELNELLPVLDRRGIEAQVVTSAVRPIPLEWAKLRNVHLVVSIDGLEEQHDRRRTPATYARILNNIRGHTVIPHCTVTRDSMGHLAEFAAFWSARPEVRKIWFSLYTPQEGEQGGERLTAPERQAAVRELATVRANFPKVYLPKVVLQGYFEPPQSPRECIFAQVTTCLSADLNSPITPCQLGGTPVCAECGCIASAGLAAIGRFRLGGLVRVSDIFALSRRIGDRA